MANSNLSLERLIDFAVLAKKNTYAAGRNTVPFPLQGFKGFEFSDGDFRYCDIYSDASDHSFIGFETIYYQGKLVWGMNYSGSMSRDYYDNPGFIKQTYNFLKEALRHVSKDHPFRGPRYFKNSDFEYINEVTGNISSFQGKERILSNGIEVYCLDYGGRILV